MSTAHHDHPDIEVDELSLTLRRPLDELDGVVREAIVSWLSSHGVPSELVALNASVERHEASSSVVWRQDGPDGRRRHHLYPAVAVGSRWPAPFPEMLLAPEVARLRSCA